MVTSADGLSKASDTLESFLSKLAFESGFRKKTFLCVTTLTLTQTMQQYVTRQGPHACGECEKGTAVGKRKEGRTARPVLDKPLDGIVG